MKAFILMKKDISFCFSWILVAVILTIIAPIYFSVENHYRNPEIIGIIRRPITGIATFNYADYK